MDALQYRGGPPPAEGWWPVRPLDGGSQEYRWWHSALGVWSLPADASCADAQAEFLKTLPAGLTDDEIEWRGWTDDERAGIAPPPPWREGEAPQAEMPNADLF